MTFFVLLLLLFGHPSTKRDYFLDAMTYFTGPMFENALAIFEVK